MTDKSFKKWAEIEEYYDPIEDHWDCTANEMYAMRNAFYGGERSQQRTIDALRKVIAEHNVILNRACGEVLWPKCKAKDSEMCETCPRHYRIDQTQGDDNELL